VLIILDNGWTSMTGHQVNPGTATGFQVTGSRRVSIEAVVRGIGVDFVARMDPFDQPAAIEVMKSAIQGSGVRVVISEKECTLTVGRRVHERELYRIDPARCTFCRACLRETGCPALLMTRAEDKQHMAIDPELCTGCGLCATCCKFDANHEVET